MNVDTMNILKFLIIFETFLLVFVRTFTGTTGLIWAVIISTLLVCGGYLFVLSFASHVSSSSNILDNEFFQVAILFSYLGLGVWTLFSADKLFNYFSYAWLASVIISVVTLFVLSYEPSEYSKMIAEERRYQRERLEEGKKEQAHANAISELKEKFEAAKAEVTEVENYIKFTERSVKLYGNKGFFSQNVGAYTASLMLYAIKDEQTPIALKLLDSYMDNVIQYTNLLSDSEVVASNAVVLSIYENNTSIFERVEKQILNKIPIQELSDAYLLYNLACYYALKKDKETMLMYIALAKKNGINPELFVNDKDNDFIHFKNDADFLTAINKT